MRTKIIIIAIIIFLLTFALCHAQSKEEKGKDFPVLKGPYLGQKPPGMTPEIFARGITTMNEHSPAAFSPDGKELFWSTNYARKFYLFHMKMINGIWTKPSVADFTKELEATNPVFTVDGKKLFFTSQVIENNQWFITLRYVEKTANGWSNQKKVHSITNFGSIDYQVSFTNDGTLYFSSKTKDGYGAKDIYRSILTNGKYSKFENLGKTINSELSEQSVYIAPDESYIIFRRHIREKNDVLLDFYISFRKNDSWTEPVCFTDKLNAKGHGFWIGLSPDQKFIFFVKTHTHIVDNYARIGSDIYWVSAKVIEECKPKKIN